MKMLSVVPALRLTRRNLLRNLYLTYAVRFVRKRVYANNSSALQGGRPSVDCRTVSIHTHVVRLRI